MSTGATSCCSATDGSRREEIGRRERARIGDGGAGLALASDRVSIALGAHSRLLNWQRRIWDEASRRGRQLRQDGRHRRYRSTTTATKRGPTNLDRCDDPLLLLPCMHLLMQSRCYLPPIHLVCWRGWAKSVAQRVRVPRAVPTYVDQLIL